MTRWIRNRPERRHEVAAGLAAGAAGAVVGAGVYWLVRLLAAREVLPETDHRERAELEGGPSSTEGAGPT